MKKPTFYFMVSLMLLGFVGDITHAHAASPTPQKEVETRTRSMAILKQSLDILENAHPRNCLRNKALNMG